MPDRLPHIVVVGSINMDLVITVKRRPQCGETVIGETFGMFIGGKGFNQAIAAARMGAHVHMIGRVGKDIFGQRCVQALQHEGIDTRAVVIDSEAATGIAMPVIDAQGDNSIIIVPGANMRLSSEDVERAADVIAQADLLMAQLEVPLATVECAAELASKSSTMVLLNPAPAQTLPDTLVRRVDILTPNETETSHLTGIAVVDDQAAYQAARVLLARGIATVVLTMGARGALIADQDHAQRVAGHRVAVVDTTAAGDAFCGALAVQVALGEPIMYATHVANAAGALATTVLGAEPALPQRSMVEHLMRGAVDRKT